MRVQNPLYSRKIGEGDPSPIFPGGGGGGGAIHSLSRWNLRFVTSRSRFALASAKYEAPEEERAATVL